MAKIEARIAMCTSCDHDSCPVQVYIRDNRIVEIRTPSGTPLPSDPPVEGCPKAQSLIGFESHPSRLNFPLKRAGRRGENKWEKISWEQALDEIAGKLERIKEQEGPEALGCIDGDYAENWTSVRFFHLFGSPNISATMSRVCKGDLRTQHYAIYGDVAFMAPPTERCNCMVFWGSQHSVSGTIMWKGEKLIKELGGKIIAIDPRRTRETELADIWLQLRPGTDAALALGWLNIIINEDLYDREFVEKWTVGFDRLKERVQEYPPERVAQITWLPEEKIIESARMYATNHPASISWGTKLSHGGRGTSEVEHARCCLRAITGNVDVDGGDLFLRPNVGIQRIESMALPEKISNEQLQKQLGSDKFKLMSWPGWDLMKEARAKIGRRPTPTWGRREASMPHIFRGILQEEPYPIKALLVIATNPLVTMADTRKVYEALQKVELHVCMDVVMTPTALLADYVLPSTFWTESPQIGLTEHQEVVLGADRVLPKMYERRDGYDFWRGLGIRLGQEEYWPWQTLEETHEYRMEPTGLTWEEFRRKPFQSPLGLKDRSYTKAGFATPSGKIELASSIYEKLGYDPLPYYLEPPESPVSTPEIAKDYPLILINGTRIRQYLHSQFRQIGKLRKRHPDPLVEINPETAKRLGIQDGDWVWIESLRGRIKQRCKYFDGIHPQAVNCEYGWWFPEKPAEEPSLHGLWDSNSNVLTSQDFVVCDEVTGSWYLSPSLCKVYKAET